MQIVIPMAGAGQRFVEAGYSLPKPLIPLGGVPMVVRVARDLPPAERTVFVCHPDHVAQHQIDRTLRAYFPQCQVAVTPGSTAGQASTVRLAGEHLDPRGDVLVAACDNTHLYDARQFSKLTSDPDIDAIVWVYRGNPRVLVRPEWYGWVRADKHGAVREVSVKQPISTSPLMDFVVSGCFWFRSATLLLEAIDALTAADMRVNGEFYLDSVPNLLLAAGRRVHVFEVEQYIGWGTPADVEDYLRWQRHFAAIAQAA